jgi:hypothetical protein
VPPRLALGGAAGDPTSPWWRLHRLRALVERDPPRLAPIVRARWDEFEDGLERETTRLETVEAPGAALEAFMEHTLDAYLAGADALLHELAR